METNQNIETLCSYFKKQICLITSITIKFNAEEVMPGDLQAFLYKKTLLLTMLDAMAGIRFSKKYYHYLHDKNRMRFTCFTRDCTNWDNGNLISVPFLFDRLSKSKEPQISNERLIKFLEKKLSQFDTNAGGIVPIEKMDEQPEALLPLTNTELEKKEIFECQHYSILYRYRNHLIHEAREPGSGMEVYDKTHAYYHGYLGEDEKWFLVYPLTLIKQLCSQCVDDLQRYLLANQIDPYDYDIVEDTSRF